MSLHQQKARRFPAGAAIPEGSVALVPVRETSRTGNASTSASSTAQTAVYQQLEESPEGAPPEVDRTLASGRAVVAARGT
jgi:hypothetical protein